MAFDKIAKSGPLLSGQPLRERARYGFDPERLACVQRVGLGPTRSKRRKPRGAAKPLSSDRITAPKVGSVATLTLSTPSGTATKQKDRTFPRSNGSRNALGQHFAFFCGSFR